MNQKNALEELKYKQGMAAAMHRSLKGCNQSPKKKKKNAEYLLELKSRADCLAECIRTHKDGKKILVIKYNDPAIIENLRKVLEAQK